MNGLDLWNAVETTDAKFTKKIEGKRFKGDAVNNVYVAKKITAQLGPVGIRWGWNVLDERVQEFGSHEDKSHTIIHWLRVAMWIKGDDGRKETFENFGTTVMAAYGRNGYSVDDDAPKKSMTDALSKLMLYLGGSADVWLNTFDPHNKYATEERPARQERQRSAPPAAAYAHPDSREPPPEDDRGEPVFPFGREGHLRGPEWLTATSAHAKRLLPAELAGWWNSDEQKKVRAAIYKARPDLKPVLEALKTEVLERVRAVQPGSVNGTGHVSPDQAMRAG